MQILESKNPLLRRICTEITKKELRHTKIQQEINALLEIVYGKNNKGEKRNTNKAMTVGLSANQVGLMKRISVVDLAIGRKKISDVHVLINPEIVWHGKTVIEKTEGCVNLNHIWGKVKRYKRIRVKAIDRSGNEMLLSLSGWPAILLQHEIDHLNGTLFIDRLEDPKKALLIEDGDYKNYKKNKKNWNKFIDVSDLVKKL
jgi:peptide deformylase